MNRITLLVFVLIIACAKKENTTAMQSEDARWQNHAKQTEIIRDEFGVPHIYGKTDADAVFGLLYAQCEDALYSDLRANLFMTEAEAKKIYHPDESH